MKVKRLLMLAIASAAFLFAGCEKEDQNDNTNQNEPQTLSEMIVGKWECTETQHSTWGSPGTFHDPTANVGSIWTFKDSGTLTMPDGVKSYSVDEEESILLISGYEPFFITISSDELNVQHTQSQDYKAEGSGRVFCATFKKIQ